jgi:hypothetical protein
VPKGLDKARELMPQIERAKKAFDHPDSYDWKLRAVDGNPRLDYGDYLAALGVTPEQVRQWRRRLKKAGEVVTLKSIPHPYADGKPTNQDKFRAQKSVTPKPTKKTTKKSVTEKFIRVDLTKAQMREIAEVREEVTITGAFSVGNGLNIPVAKYQANAKALILGLEQRITNLNKESVALVEANRDLYFESNLGASNEALVLKKKVAKLNGASKACEAAIRAIAFGDTSTDDPERNVYGWYEERRDKQLGIAEEPAPLPTKTSAQLDRERRLRDKKKVVPPAPAKPEGVTKPKTPLRVALDNVVVGDEYGYVVFDLEQESEYVLRGKRNSKWDRWTMTHSPSKESDKNPEWHYVYRDIGGMLSTTVFMPHADEHTVTEALLAKFKEMLTKLGMWRDKLEKEFREMVQETLEWNTQQKEERSARAKHAAAKRALQKAAAGAEEE